MSAANRRLRPGAIDYLSKPLNPLILRAKVGALAELYQRHRNLENINHTHAAVAEPSDDAIVSKDLDGIIATFTEGLNGSMATRPKRCSASPILIPTDR
jgi:DNA-binding response OmpR family regulator